MQTKSSKLQQIISHFYSKSLHIIVGSRVPALHSPDNEGLSTSSRAKKSDEWFNLLLGDRPAALDNSNHWLRNLMDPMIIDIVLVREGTSSCSYTRTVIERWVVQYECPPRELTTQTGDNNTCDCKKAYQKSIVLFRSLYSQMRLLPVNRIFRQQSKSTNTCNFDITYEVSSFSEPFSRAEEEMMEEYDFKAVEAFPGRLCISVTYRSKLSDLNLDFSMPLPPKLVKDYVGSPNTSPLMSFPSREKGVEHHRHGWTSGFHKAAVTKVGSQPIICRPCLRRSDFPTDGFGNRIPNHPNLDGHRPTSYTEYRPSTFSPSPSPSRSRSRSHSLSPRSFFLGNPMQTQLPSAAVPATISLLGSTKDDNSLQKHSSGMRSSKKIDAHRVGGVHSRTVNHGVHKIVRDNKEDSGLFSELFSSSSSLRTAFSRSSGKSSFQDDFDDWDSSYPFNVDDADMRGVQPSQNVDDKNASEITSKALPTSRRSQDAEIGVLVHMLKAAPPLHQDPSSVPSQSLEAEIEEGVAPASGSSVLRKTDDALEELSSYRKMRDFLLSTSQIGKYEA